MFLANCLTACYLHHLWSQADATLRGNAAGSSALLIKFESKDQLTALVALVELGPHLVIGVPGFGCINGLEDGQG